MNKLRINAVNEAGTNKFTSSNFLFRKFSWRELDRLENLHNFRSCAHFYFNPFNESRDMLNYLIDDGKCDDGGNKIRNTRKYL